MTCGGCQFHFAIDEAYYDKCMTNYDNYWYCPKCGSHRHFIGETETDKLKRELKQKENAIEAERERSLKLRSRLQFQKNVARGQKAAKTRALNRIKNGVCPCCNRTFADLAKHMASKHPTFEPTKYI
jgi:hypothetical protein